MPLNHEQQQKALAHLNTKWKNKTCGVCEGNNWDIHPELYELRQFNQGNMVLGGPLIPLLIVECTNCGNTISMNAIRAGVVSADESAEGSND